MKKYVLNILLVMAMVLGMVTTVFAEDGVETPNYPTGSNMVYLPMLNTAGLSKLSQPGGELQELKIDASMVDDLPLAATNAIDRSLLGSGKLMPRS